MPRSAPRLHRSLLPHTVVPAAVRQIAAVVAVGAIGATALGASGGAAAGLASSATATSAAPAGPSPHRQAQGRPVESVTGGPSGVKHATSAAKPAVHRPAAKKSPTRAKPAMRWIPSGTGMWIYQWGKSNGGNAARVVSRARSAGLTHLFVRTGSTHDHYTGGAVLDRLLPATAHTGIKVIAWDFPELKNPQKDAWRLAYAAYADIHSKGPHVAAVAPDIETPAEGTHTSAARVSLYLATLRRLLPRNVSILTTVPWPSSSRVGRYPYQAVAARSDALLPMAYWYDNSPTEVTATSISFLRRYGRPVQPVGQGYDGKLDVPSIPHNNLRKQMPMFFVTARRLGVSAVSIWSWQAAPPTVWGYLSYAARNRWFPAR